VIPESRDAEALRLDRAGVALSIAVRAGLALLAASFVWIAFTITVDLAYMTIVEQMDLIGAGLGLTTARATESIMGSLDADKTGIGSYGVR
jgi:hypothetical protein